MIGERAALAAALLLAGGASIAQSPIDSSGTVSGPTCNDAGILSGGAISKLCMDCFFPISISGTPMGGTTRDVPLPARIAEPVCICPGVFGYPTPGVPMGMWQPTHLVEQTRAAYCSPALGSAGNQSLSSMRKAGPQGTAGNESGRHEDGGSSYYNAHIFKFPLQLALEGITDAVCQSAESAANFSLMWMSEIDPTHRNDELALFQTPEAVLFASPVAAAACVADSISASVWQPLDVLFWCHGSFGLAYPYSGTIGQSGHPAREAAASAAKLIASLHRRMMMTLTYSYPGVCGDVPWPQMPKTQYKLQVMHPIPEVVDNHWIGETGYKWASQHIPVVGEDHVNALWTYQQCCALNL